MFSFVCILFELFVATICLGHSTQIVFTNEVDNLNNIYRTNKFQLDL